MQLYIEPVIPSPHLVVVGRSPMAATLVDLATALGWRASLVDSANFSRADTDYTSVVVVATQGHGDEEAIVEAIAGNPAFIGLVASRKRSESVLGYLADRGMTREGLDRVRAPVGLDLGHTSHAEIAVAVLAELVQLRAAGELTSKPKDVAEPPATAIDPVCGMTVAADETSRPLVHEGETYYFCAPGCRVAFEKDPAAYIPRSLHADQE